GAESVAGSPWPLTAGPWREGWDALARADVIVVTRKHATADAATALARRLEAGEGQRGRTLLVCVAHLAVSQLEGMRSGAPTGLQVLGGRRVLAAAGIADPESFAAQLRGLGPMVHTQAYQDRAARYPAGEGHLPGRGEPVRSDDGALRPCRPAA